MMIFKNLVVLFFGLILAIIVGIIGSRKKAQIARQAAQARVNQGGGSGVPAQSVSPFQAVGFSGNRLSSETPSTSWMPASVASSKIKPSAPSTAIPASNTAQNNSPQQGTFVQSYPTSFPNPANNNTITALPQNVPPAPVPDQIKVIGQPMQASPLTSPVSATVGSTPLGTSAPTLTQRMANLPASMTQTAIYRQFHEAKEYNTQWLNPDTGFLQLVPGDQPIVPNWTPLQITLKTSVSERIKTVVTLMLYFAIYAIIAYIIPNEHRPNDNAFNAFFFPVLPFILISYRSVGSYLSAIALSFLLMYFVFIPAINADIITWEGVIFLYYFSFLLDFFGLKDFPFTNVMEVTSAILLILFILEGVLLIINWILSSKPKVDMVITQRNLFLRDKTKRSMWENMKLILYTIINPLNINQYRMMRKRVAYNKMSAVEGHYYDYTRIPLKAVKEVDKNSNSIAGGMVIGIIIIIIGAFAFIPIALVGLIIMIKAWGKHGTYDVKIHINREDCEGSWIMSHNSDIIHLDRTPEELAKFFVPLKNW